MLRPFWKNSHNQRSLYLYCEVPVVVEDKILWFGGLRNRKADPCNVYCLILTMFSL